MRREERAPDATGVNGCRLRRQQATKLLVSPRLDIEYNQVISSKPIFCLLPRWHEYKHQDSMMKLDIFQRLFSSYYNYV